MTSCSGWFDTEPNDGSASENVFNSETSFRDYMNSIYCILAGEDLYGEQITITSEVMGGTLDVSDYDNYVDLAKFTFADADNVAYAEAIYTRLYRAIYGCNDILRLFESNSDVSFVSGSKEMMMAEAKALRAFLHMELARLFLVSPAAMDDAQTLYWAESIDQLGTKMTATEIYEKAVEELEAAAAVLEVNDPIVNGEDYNENSLLGASPEERVWKLNYYAVQAVKARALLSVATEDAAAEALTTLQGIISSEAYSFVKTISNKDYAFSAEYLFALPSTSYGTTFSEVNEELYVNKGIMVTSTVDKDGMYEDDRRRYWIDDNNSLSVKFDESNTLDSWGISPAIPVVKYGEVYLMAIEAAINSNNLSTAISLYNAFITERNSSSYVLDSSADEALVQAALDSQFVYEFLGEGVRYQYLKRNNMSAEAFDGTTITNFGEKVFGADLSQLIK